MARKGEKLTDNPKNFMLRVRLDRKTLKILDECANILNTSRSEVVRESLRQLHKNVSK